MSPITKTNVLDKIVHEFLMRRDLDISLIRAFLAVVDADGVTAGRGGAGRQPGGRQPADQAAGGGARLPPVRAPGPQAGAGAGGRAAARPGAPPAGAERRGAGRPCARRRSRARSASACPTTSSAASCRPSCAASPRPSRACASAWCARIRASCATQLRSGGVDLALTTETDCGRHGETLRTDRLVWVGVPGGEAHLRDPLPVSLGAPTCVFRPVADRGAGHGCGATGARSAR